MSSNGLSHSIRNSHEEFDRGIYDSTDHRNLYVLDLNCDYAIEVLRQVLNVYFFFYSRVVGFAQIERFEEGKNYMTFTSSRVHCLLIVKISYPSSRNTQFV